MITNKDKPVRIEYDMKYEGMYRLVWEDNIPSADMYNLQRANDILNNYDEYRLHMRMVGTRPKIEGVTGIPSSPADALKR